MFLWLEEKKTRVWIYSWVWRWGEERSGRRLISQLQRKTRRDLHLFDLGCTVIIGQRQTWSPRLLNCFHVYNPIKESCAIWKKLKQRVRPAEIKRENCAEMSSTTWGCNLKLHLTRHGPGIQRASVHTRTHADTGSQKMTKTFESVVKEEEKHNFSNPQFQWHTAVYTRTHARTQIPTIFLRDHFCLPPCNRINEPISGCIFSHGSRGNQDYYPAPCIASRPASFLNVPAHANSRTAGIDQWENLRCSAGRGDSAHNRSRWPHQASIWLPRQADRATKERGSNASLSKRGWELQLGASPQARWVGQAGAHPNINNMKYGWAGGKEHNFWKAQISNYSRKAFFFFAFAFAFADGWLHFDRLWGFFCWGLLFWDLNRLVTLRGI